MEGREDEEQELTVCGEATLQKKADSLWGWHEDFAVEWSETF